MSASSSPCKCLFTPSMHKTSCCYHHLCPKRLCSAHILIQFFFKFQTMSFIQCIFSSVFRNPLPSHIELANTLYCSEKSKVSILVVSLEAVVEGWEEATTLTLARVSPCCLGLGLCVLRADFLRQLAHGGRAESSSPGLQPCYTGLRPSSVPP